MENKESQHTMFFDHWGDPAGIGGINYVQVRLQKRKWVSTHSDVIVDYEQWLTVVANHRPIIDERKIYDRHHHNLVPEPQMVRNAIAAFDAAVAAHPSLNIDQNQH